MDSDRLLDLLRKSVRRCIGKSGSVAIAYSGGVDSAVIEALARESATTRCYTCATQGSHDLATTPLRAAESGIDLRVELLDGGALKALVSKACHLLQTDEPQKVAYTVPVICVIDRCAEDVVLTGSGADELFGGYAKYLEDSNPGTSMDRDMDKMLVETERLRVYAQGLGRMLETPFAGADIREFANQLPIERKLGTGNRKVVLRDAAKTLGVLSHDTPKKAAQYSSGVLKEMRRMAKEEGRSLRDWTAATAADEGRVP